jgi:1-acyl-sn-glycerol-3-phosphate acyltransferase
VRQVARVVLAPFRPRAEGVENIPDGPVILASNHGSYFDHFLIGIFVKRPLNFMTAAEFFGSRTGGEIMRRMGGFPVKRGARDSDALDTAAMVLARGGLVVIYPEGGVRHAEISDRPRPGVGGVALHNGAAVVPVAIHPSAKLHKYGFLRFPQVTVRFGQALRHEREPETDRERDQQAADAIWAQIVALYRGG